MKILLLNPPFLHMYSRSSRSPAVTRSGTVYYPIYLSYCCGILEKEGFEVKLVDAPARHYGLGDVLRIVRKVKPKIVVIETSTPSIYNDIKVAEAIKNVIKAFIVLVGTHVSALPEETLKLSDKIDAVARKEYDHTVKDLAYTLKEGRNPIKVLGISYRKGKKIIHNPDRPFIENLDELPFVTSVYKKHLNIEDYFFAAAEYPMVMIMTGRGCPFRCFFCNWPQVFHGRRYRLRSAENVVAEFEYVLKNLPQVREIGIEDDTFSANLERARTICKLLIKKGINKKIKWWANTRVNLDLKTMKLMKKAGCRLVIPGYESGVQEILNNINKGITIKQSLKFARNAKKAGLLVHGCFILGLPGETKESIRKTIEFAKKLNPDTAQFFPLMAYPGTEAYDWARKNNYLSTNDFSKWLNEDGQHTSIINIAGLTSEQIIDYCRQARKEFYLRKEYVFYKVKQSLSNFEEAKRNVMALRTFFKHIF